MNTTVPRTNRRAAILAALGLASGAAGAFVYQLEPLWRELSVGVVFGVAMAGAFVGFRMAPSHKAIAFAGLAVLSWWAAERLAIEIFTGLTDSDAFLSWQGLITGVAAGLVGAALLMLSLVLLFPPARRAKPALTIVLTGGALGALFTLIGVADSGLVLFPPWQAAIAYAIARALPLPAATPKPWPGRTRHP